MKKHNKKRKNKKRRKYLYIAFSPSLKNGIKIGFTYDLKKRLKSLSSTVPESYIYLCLLEISNKTSDKDFLNQLEANYHCRFKKVDDCLYYSEFINTNKIPLSVLISEISLFAENNQITDSLYINDSIVELLIKNED